MISKQSQLIKNGTESIKHTSSNKTHGDDSSEEDVEVSGSHVSLQVVDKRKDLTQTKHSQSSHVLRGLDWSKPYEGDLH